MNPDERKLLEETLLLARENNILIKKLHRSVVWGRIWHALYWVVIIAASVGAFYAIQPYVESVTGAYEQVTGAKAEIGNFFSF